MNEKFLFPKQVPDYQAEVPLYRVSRFKTFSPRIEELQIEFDQRVRRLQEAFGLGGEAEDLGTQVVFQDGPRILEVYRPSDSFWWTDLETAYREQPPQQAELPGDEQAREIALEQAQRLGLDTDLAHIASVTRTTVAVSEAEHQEEFKRVDTEVHVNFIYALDGHPILGPGAKIKISMVEEGRVGNVLQFWREPAAERDVRLRHPVEVLQRMTEGRRYASFSPEMGSVHCEKMRFGYYAMPPFEFQKYLIPVYEISGLEETEAQGRQPFTVFAPAMDLPPERIKEMGFTDQPDLARVLASTK